MYQPDNEIIDHIRLSMDMKPQDGWELLRREMGYNQDGTPKNPKPENPYIVMYNKYTSILRVFYARSSSQPYSAARISLQFSATSGSESSLLDLSNGLIALDKPFAKDKVFIANSSFDNRLNQWFYADFPMQYDPCSCLYSSRLEISVDLINQADIDISGTANGKLMAINNQQGPINQQDKTYSFADLQGQAKKTSKVFKDITKFKEDQMAAVGAMLPTNPTAAANKTLNLTPFQSALKQSSFLKTGLAAAPYIGAAISLLDFFIGGGRKIEPALPQEVKLTPTSIDMTIKLNGTLTTNHTYGSILFWNPGSNNAQYSDEDYPYYNEIMGIFNLTETPKINSTFSQVWVGDRGDGSWRTTIQYRVQNPVKYVINPAADLAIQDAQVALVVEGDSSSLSGPAGGVWEMEGKDEKSGKWQYRSIYVDVNCLNKQLFQIRGDDAPGNINWIPNGKYYLKFLLNLKRLSDPVNSQNVLMVVKYPLEIVPVTSFGTVGTSCTGSMFVPATNNEINTLCNSTTYKNNRVYRTRPSIPSSVEKESELETSSLSKIVVAPNPAKSYTDLTFEVNNGNALSIFVADIYGRKLVDISNGKSYVPGVYTERIYLKHLSRGIYNVVVQTASAKIVKKVILN